eukprot:2423721-Alexandrium_andersonii.AAC.1
MTGHLHPLLTSPNVARTGCQMPLPPHFRSALGTLRCWSESFHSCRNRTGASCFDFSLGCLGMTKRMTRDGKLLSQSLRYIEIEAVRALEYSVLRKPGVRQALMGKRMHVSRGPGSYPRRETLYVSDVILDPNHGDLCARERDRRVLQSALNQDRECMSGAGAHPPRIANAVPPRACVALART